MILGLREHLLAVSGGSQPQASALTHDTLRAGPPSGGPDSNIDPGLSGAQYAQMDVTQGDGSSANLSPNADDPRKGRRELSTSKRAAQNRAAQVCPLFHCSCVLVRSTSA